MPARGSDGPSSSRAGLGGHPLQQLLHVPALEGGIVDLRRALGCAESTRVPGQHVEPGLLQRRDVDRSQHTDRVRVVVTGQAPPRTHEHRRSRVLLGGATQREPVQAQPGAVERHQVQVAVGTGHGRGRHRPGHALHLAGRRRGVGSRGVPVRRGGPGGGVGLRFRVGGACRGGQATGQEHGQGPAGPAGR